MTLIKRFPSALVFTLFCLAAAASAQTPRISGVNLTAEPDRVRASAQGGVYGLSMEVVDEAGDTVFQGSQIEGRPLDWNMKDAGGRKVLPGTYTVTVSYTTQAGKSRKRIEQVMVSEEVTAGGAETAETPTALEPTPQAVGAITGEGVAGRLARFTGANSIGNSIVTESALKIGINTTAPVSKLHVLSAANDSPPRLQSTGTTSFAAGWDFYHGATPKGYVGVPGAGQGLAPGEMLLYGSPGVKTSLWAGGARAITVLTNGNVGIGPNAASPTLAKLQVSGDGLIGVRSATSGADAFSGTTTGGGAGVSGKNLAGTGFGVRGESNGASGVGVLARNSTGVALKVEGHAQQNRDKGGLVKAMLYVNGDGAILRCYNGQTGASSGNCGFGVNHGSSGSYSVDFNFQVNDRFVSVSVQNYNNVGLNPDAGVSFIINSSPTDVVGVQTYEVGAGPSDRPFMLIVY